MCHWFYLSSETSTLKAHSINVSANQASNGNIYICVFWRCKYQVNDILMSHALFPEKSSFQLRKGFCVLAKKLFERPCVSPQKRALLEENFPKLCGLIKSRQNLIGNCDNWPQQFFNRPGIYSYISVYTYLPIYTCPYIHRIYIYIPTYIYLPIHP